MSGAVAMSLQGNPVSFSNLNQSMLFDPLSPLVTRRRESIYDSCLYVSLKVEGVR